MALRLCHYSYQRSSLEEIVVVLRLAPALKVVIWIIVLLENIISGSNAFLFNNSSVATQ
jgi:hypothetical protein